MSAYSTYDRIMEGGFIAEDICIPRKFLVNLVTIFFPPLGVIYHQYLLEFPEPTKIFISIILTALFYFPGLIYSLNVVSCSGGNQNLGYCGSSDTDATEDVLINAGVNT